METGVAHSECESNVLFLAKICSMEVTSSECLSEVRTLLSQASSITAARSLQGNEAQVFVDFLDQVLAQQSLENKFRQRGLLLLSKICKDRCIIPRSYNVREEMIIGRVCHRSRFAEVSQGECSGFPVAIKRLSVNLEGDYNRVFKRLCREVIEWKYLIHPNILPLFGVSVIADSNCINILTEWMPNGDIIQYAKSHPKVNRLRLLSEVMTAVAYLHGLRIVHGDLKGKNILVDVIDGTAIARVTDFGLMTMTDLGTEILSESAISSAGTFRWMSPELLDPGRFNSNGRLTCESDCYALGMVIYEVLTGRPPFYHMRAFSPVTAVVMDGERPEKPLDSRSLGFSDALWELVQLCWSQSTSIRPTAWQLSNGLSSAAPTWVPPTVYPIEVCPDDTTAGSSSSSRILNLIGEA